MQTEKLTANQLKRSNKSVNHLMMAQDFCSFWPLMYITFPVVPDK